MRINRAPHIPWVMFVVVATGVASLFYTAELHPQRLPARFRFFGEMPFDHSTIGGTPLGLILGSISLAIFIFAALLGARKRLPFLLFGHVQRWLRAHIWLTLLTVPLILLHSGFHVGGPMTTTLMALYAIVMVSGIYGLILQQRLPTLMKEQLPAEIVYEQIPNIRRQLYTAAERLYKTYRHEPVAKAKLGPRFAPTPTALATEAVPDVSMHAVVKTPTAVEKPMGGATIRGTPVNPAAFVTSDAADADGIDPSSDADSETTLADFI